MRVLTLFALSNFSSQSLNVFKLLEIARDRDTRTGPEFVELLSNLEHKTFSRKAGVSYHKPQLVTSSQALADRLLM